MTADQAMIDGVQQFLSKQASVTVGSQTLTPAAIVKVFQDRITAGKAAQPAEAARTAAVKADRDAIKGAPPAGTTGPTAPPATPAKPNS